MASTHLGPGLGEVRVDLRVVLAVVADEEPADRAGSPWPAGRASARLCSWPLRNQPGVGRPPVGEEQRPDGVPVAAEEPVERRRGVPGAGRDVDDRCTRVLGQQLAVHRRHPGHDAAGALVLHEGVPGGDHHPGQRRGDHGVVDVADQAAGDLRADDDDLGLDVLGALGGDRHAVPPRLQAVVAEGRVDVAGAVAARVERAAVDPHRHGDAHGRCRDERAPAPITQEQASACRHRWGPARRCPRPRPAPGRAGPVRRPG